MSSKLTAAATRRISPAPMTYEYVCTACAHEWEASQSINDAPLKKCPQCRKSTARRQISGGTGFVLKGGGWYADGYASSSPGNKPAADTGSDTASEATSATKSTDASPKPEKSKAKKETPKAEPVSSS